MQTFDVSDEINQKNYLVFCKKCVPEDLHETKDLPSILY